ncbi:uncharacterized protein LOC124173300 isoform X2 [Ischnura elegans]|uniref:uncharacterized protein LOC124173300 isoform X2 n=1 Tax=Ischnura elegans TaxID=197161 RepID=UPI001ED877B1|nr:uncharacterized protein LOC124173300 isoform X2 [Ischnura elegans]
MIFSFDHLLGHFAHCAPLRYRQYELVTQMKNRWRHHATEIAVRIPFSCFPVRCGRSYNEVNARSPRQLVRDHSSMYHHSSRTEPEVSTQQRETPRVESERHSTVEEECPRLLVRVHTTLRHSRCGRRSYNTVNARCPRLLVRDHTSRRHSRCGRSYYEVNARSPRLLVREHTSRRHSRCGRSYNEVNARCPRLLVRDHTIRRHTRCGRRSYNEVNVRSPRQLVRDHNSMYHHSSRTEPEVSTQQRERPRVESERHSTVEEECPRLLVRVHTTLRQSRCGRRSYNTVNARCPRLLVRDHTSSRHTRCGRRSYNEVNVRSPRQLVRDHSSMCHHSSRTEPEVSTQQRETPRVESERHSTVEEEVQYKRIKCPRLLVRVQTTLRYSRCGRRSYNAVNARCPRLLVRDHSSMYHHSSRTEPEVSTQQRETPRVESERHSTVEEEVQYKRIKCPRLLVRVHTTLRQSRCGRRSYNAVNARCQRLIVGNHTSRRHSRCGRRSYNEVNARSPRQLVRDHSSMYHHSSRTEPEVSTQQRETPRVESERHSTVEEEVQYKRIKCPRLLVRVHTTLRHSRCGRRSYNTVNARCPRLLVRDHTSSRHSRCGRRSYNAVNARCPRLLVRDHSSMYHHSSRTEPEVSTQQRETPRVESERHSTVEEECPRLLVRVQTTLRYSRCGRRSYNAVNARCPRLLVRDHSSMYHHSSRTEPEVSTQQRETPRVESERHSTVEEEVQYKRIKCPRLLVRVHTTLRQSRCGRRSYNAVNARCQRLIVGNHTSRRHSRCGRRSYNEVNARSPRQLVRDHSSMYHHSSRTEPEVSTQQRETPRVESERHSTVEEEVQYKRIKCPRLLVRVQTTLRYSRCGRRSYNAVNARCPRLLVRDHSSMYHHSSRTEPEVSTQQRETPRVESERHSTVEEECPRLLVRVHTTLRQSRCGRRSYNAVNARCQRLIVGNHTSRRHSRCGRRSYNEVNARSPRQLVRDHSSMYHHSSRTEPEVSTQQRETPRVESERHSTVEEEVQYKRIKCPRLLVRVHTTLRHSRCGRRSYNTVNARCPRLLVRDHTSSRHSRCGRRSYNAVNARCPRLLVRDHSSMYHHSSRTEPEVSTQQRETPRVESERHSTVEEEVQYKRIKVRVFPEAHF